LVAGLLGNVLGVDLCELDCAICDWTWWIVDALAGDGEISSSLVTLDISTSVRPVRQLTVDDHVITGPRGAYFSVRVQSPDYVSCPRFVPVLVTAVVQINPDKWILIGEDETDSRHL
jgi:hypothetical protein